MKAPPSVAELVAHLSLGQKRTHQFLEKEGFVSAIPRRMYESTINFPRATTDYIYVDKTRFDVWDFGRIRRDSSYFNVTKKHPYVEPFYINPLNDNSHDYQWSLLKRK